MSAGWLRISRDIRLLVLSMLIWELGLTLYDPFLAVHLRQLGAEAGQIGAIFAAAYLLVALTSLPAGWLADRFDRRRVMIFFWCSGASSVLFLAFASRWEQALPGIFLYFFSFMAFPAINAYITDAAEQGQHAAAFALFYATFPAAQLVGPGVGGLLAEQFGMRVLFLVSFGFYLASTLVVASLAAQRPPHPALRFEVGRFLAPLARPAFRQVALLAAAAYLFFTALLRFISPYLAESYGLGLALIGLLNGIAALGGAVLTPLSGPVSERIGRVGALAGGVLVFGLSLILIGGSAALPALVLAFLLQGSFPAARSLLDSIVAHQSKGAQAGLTFGAFGLLTGLGQALAPAAGGWLYGISPRAAFFTAGAAGLLLAGGLLRLRNLDES